MSKADTGAVTTTWREKFEPKFEADPELRASAEAYKKYFRDRR